MSVTGRRQEAAPQSLHKLHVQIWPLCCVCSTRNRVFLASRSRLAARAISRNPVHTLKAKHVQNSGNEKQAFLAVGVQVLCRGLMAVPVTIEKSILEVR